MRITKGLISSVLLAVVVVGSAQWQAHASTSAQVQSPNAQRAGHTMPASPNAQASPKITLPDPAKGSEIGAVYEAYLSPQQEPGEEKDTPALTPAEFRSTAPSLLRNERKSRGYGIVRFTKDLSKVYVDVRVANVKAGDIVMFHIHCGKPDVLGPILVDLALTGDLPKSFEDNVFSAEITNEIIVKTSQSGHGVVGAFTAGCPVGQGLPDKVKTIAGMESIARQGELYFNLHTKGQVFYGDIRGRLQWVANTP
jgi:hypothetical protein